MRDAVRKPQPTRFGEAAVRVARANRRWAYLRASESLDDAPHSPRRSQGRPRRPSYPPDGPTDRPPDLYGSLSRTFGITPFMDRYLDHHRRVLLRDGKCRNLWVSKNRTAMAEQTLYTAVRDRTEEAFGKPINLHMFRDAAATSIAIEDPDHVRIAATLLGHSSLATTQKYYDQSRMLAAGRNYQSTLNQLRNKLRTEMRSPHKINTGARSNRENP